ncbi:MULTISPECIES: orotidine-5'-phosphate decarboxylase [Idiomarina]|jgi:orotidine-5'-phosphate decarboxylase|uniref:orotidine-5'-phosphate decarboxylase n=1 Tax=Idiomarina TaxID=135575 RepID=UPI000C58DA78|nr:MULTISPECIES: orotidine-5'-phosphate decarboxylase [Idiomarina]MAB21198.1 orotidine-5'-phosphate decarboxylase [Idiomarina sp.]MBH95244.1 orotidine-5'-phosphate decarboxylase [Idiomarina sp.]MBP58054.1 orotidine-5'-phosphate decarboxylase [Idiomarina sp.]HAS16140.1 orotidine-5'-phosphate decarboxylase [Idiomarina abyssalis]|tara:strand:- start:1795 stop:2490 length:696 start_codon:yes stop_codon:yes gene_type:complete
MALPKIYVALDCQTQEEADQLVSRLPSGQVGLKVGKELFTSIGPEWVRKQVEQGFSIFLDLKFHDIPNTVAKAVTSAAKIGVDIVNVHASGGSDMMKAAKDALEPFDNPPLLIAVTVLTSMSDADLADIGIQVTAEQQVLNLAKLTQKAGLDGVVCSAQEARMLKDALGESFKLVTPGIRPTNSATDDQKRVMTPKEAILAGVDYMVIGRPITRSENPEETVAEILASIGE